MHYFQIQFEPNDEALAQKFADEMNTKLGKEIFFVGCPCPLSVVTDFVQFFYVFSKLCAEWATVLGFIWKVAETINAKIKVSLPDEKETQTCQSLAELTQKCDKYPTDRIDIVISKSISDK